MKLKKLTIHSYKNLDDTYSFENNNGYIALIGLNGSGKSNLIEIISMIFDSLLNKDSLLDQKDVDNSYEYLIKSIYEYSIEYEIEGDTYIYAQKDGKKIYKKNGIACKANEISTPSSLIACYSGEDRRLWSLAYESYHLSYFSKAVKSSQYTPSLMYIDRSCWDIALLSLICSKDAAIVSFLKNTLNIDAPIDVDFTFKVNDKKRAAFRSHPALSWFDRICSNGLTNISGNFISSIDIVLSAKTIPDEQKAKYIFHFLYLLSQPEKRGKNKIQRLIDDIQISVKGIDFSALSEGQKKLILIECITKVLGDKESLVLLDEPDAHTHIAMKKDLLELISEFEGQTIMTTHSPMFLNKRWEGFNENNIFYMHEGKMENTEPLKHLADLTNNEIDYFEGSFILSSKKILVTEGPYDILYIKHAIDKFAVDNPNYLKIKEQVAFLHAGGSDNAVELYEQTLYPAHDHYTNLVFLFDYDKGGYEGSEKVKEKMSSYNDTKPVLLFYQDNYSILKNRRPVDKDTDSYMVEDLFDSQSYSIVINEIHQKHSHKEFRNHAWNSVLNSHKRVKSTDDAIKTYIQENYTSFGKEMLQNFKPVLDKLMEVFDLN